MRSESVLEKFENSLYQPGNIHLIPKECRAISDEMAAQAYSNYLNKYRHCGISETNAVQWAEGFTRNCVTYMEKISIIPGGLIMTSRLAFAIHELMHVEETAKFSPERKSQTGDKLLTTLTSRP